MSSYEDLTDAELLALPTHRLYTIYKLYRKSDLWISGNSHYDEYYGDDAVLASRHQHIQTKCELIKVELDNRGHIPRKHNPTGDNIEKPYSKFRTWLEHKREPKHGSIENYEDAIGKQVYKNSKKPFKSKNIYNTVKAVTINPHTHLPAFEFEEDSSIVDANICNIKKVKNETHNI